MKNYYSSMHSNTFILKAQINNKAVLLKLLWDQNEVDLFHLQILCDDGKSWSGAFSNDRAQTFIDDLYQTKEVYYANTKKCLTGEGNDEYKLDVSISGDGDTAKFCWKKKYEDFIQVQGSLTLNKDNTYLSKDTLIDCLIDENKALRSTIKKLDNQINEMNAELVKCKSELEKFVNNKTSVEESLYGKFVQLLNTKKQRIQLLEEQLKNYMN